MCTSPPQSVCILHIIIFVKQHSYYNSKHCNHSHFLGIMVCTIYYDKTFVSESLFSVHGLLKVQVFIPGTFEGSLIRLLHENT